MSSFRLQTTSLVVDLRLLKGFYHSPNLVGKPFPIHGNGFQVPWQVSQVKDHEICLTLQSRGPSRFQYSALLRYVLKLGLLHMKLEVTNEAEKALPYGLGFHP